MNQDWPKNVSTLGVKSKSGIRIAENASARCAKPATISRRPRSFGAVLRSRTARAMRWTPKNARLRAQPASNEAMDASTCVGEGLPCSDLVLTGYCEVFGDELADICFLHESIRHDLDVRMRSCMSCTVVWRLRLDYGAWPIVTTFSGTGS